MTKLKRVLEDELRKWPSQKALAEHLGMTPAFLSQLLHGKARGERSLVEIAKRLGISPLELMDGVTTVLTEDLAQDDRIPVYSAAKFLERYASGGMIRDILPGGAEKPGEVEGMERSDDERERRVGILIENNTYQPALTEGDVVIVDPDEPTRAGDLCLIVMGEELLIRRLVQTSEEQTTYALPHDEFRQEVIKSSSPVRMEIWGKAVQMRRRL